MKRRKIPVVWALLVGAACSGEKSDGTVAVDSSATQSTRVAVPTTNGIDPTLWLTTGSGHTAVIDSTTNRAKLVEMFGAANVVDGSIRFADAPALRGTVVFPNDSSRRVEVIWVPSKPGDRLAGIRLQGEHGRWAVDPGIRLGMRLTELERINGRPFRILGFNGYHDGSVMSWAGGHLAGLTSGFPHISLQLALAATDTIAVRDSAARGRQISSHDATMQELNPHVASISISYIHPVYH